MKNYRKKKKLKIKKENISKDLLKYDEKDIQHYKNNRIRYYETIMGLNNSNNFEFKKKESINKQMGIPNRIQNCSEEEIERLKQYCDFFFYDKKSNEDILIDDVLNYFRDVKSDFFITIQPNISVSKDRIKELFNFLLCKWGYFLYGKQFPEKLRDKFIVFFEKGRNEHIHLLLLDYPTEKIRLFAGYIWTFFDIFFNDCYIYIKVADDRENALLYSIKKDDTIIMTDEDFRR